MTLEELQAALAQAQADLAAERAAKQQLETNQGNQNSYITKLEGQINALKQDISTLQVTANKDPKDASGIDPTLVNYLKKQMRKDIETEGYSRIQAMVTAEVWKALEKEFNEFIKETMNEANMSPEYMVDAFRLVYGRAMTNKDHPVNKIGQVNPPQQRQPFTPPTLPPTMTPSDTSAATGLPGTQAAAIKNTQDAMKAFRDKFRSAGQNTFM